MTAVSGRYSRFDVCAVIVRYARLCGFLVLPAVQSTSFIFLLFKTFTDCFLTFQTLQFLFGRGRTYSIPSSTSFELLLFSPASTLNRRLHASSSLSEQHSTRRRAVISLEICSSAWADGSTWLKNSLLLQCTAWKGEGSACCIRFWRMYLRNAEDILMPCCHLRTGETVCRGWARR